MKLEKIDSRHYDASYTAEIEETLPNNIELSDKEIEMARHLVNSMISKFEPSKYVNEYQDRVMQLIESKAEQHVIAEPAPGKVVDLMAALEASIEATTAKLTTTKKTKKPKLKKEA